jgi:hypothetical protein
MIHHGKKEKTFDISGKRRNQWGFPHSPAFTRFYSCWGFFLFYYLPIWKIRNVRYGWSGGI